MVRRIAFLLLYLVVLGLLASLLSLVMTLWSASANAQEPPRDVELSWTNATMRTDGSMLEPGELLNTIVFWSHSSDPQDLRAAPSEQTVVVDYPINEVVVPVPVGDWYFAAVHLARCPPPNEEGCTLQSALSNTVFHEVRHTAEKPTDFAVELQLQVSTEGLAYTSVKINNGQVMLPLTNVPPETACIMTEAIISQGEVYYAVPVEALVWPPNDVTIRPTVAYARCD